ncbi:MAG: transcription antitermination factor NusB [Acutalibacteraceae bacterium]|nr:transcription antitermination factor NusB [Acutalibacteraceae bacterium]
MTRKESREQAFILLFEYSFTGDTADELFETATEAGCFIEDEYCVSVVKTAIEKVEETDEIISRYAKGWKTERLSKVVLAALRLAVTEINYFTDIPNSVSINEAVEIIKKYATAQDAVFANGILGSVVKG